MPLPLILITNDDGYDARGIQVLAGAVSRLGEVYIVAPDGGRSGVACAISSTTPVSFANYRHQSDIFHEATMPDAFEATVPDAFPSGYSPSIHLYSCTGTPVDCVKLAIERILPRRPDLILSGINHGDNASISIHYSGTMGAAMEGCMKDIPSIGVSLYLRRGETYDNHPVPPDTLTAIADLCERVLAQGLPQGVCLNINIPQSDHFGGWQVCRQTRGQWTAEWLPTDSPNTFHLTGTFTDLEPHATDTDFAALRAGRCSIVPIHVDMTAHQAIETIKHNLVGT